LDLLTEFDHIAIGLSLGFVAADDSDYLLRVTLGHLCRALLLSLLSLCAYRHGGDRQNGHHRPHADTGPDVLKCGPAPRRLLRRKSGGGKAAPHSLAVGADFVVVCAVTHGPDPSHRADNRAPGMRINQCPLYPRKRRSG